MNQSNFKSLKSTSEIIKENCKAKPHQSKHSKIQKQVLNKVKSMQFIHESNLSFSSLSNAQLKQNTSKDSLINIAQKINKNIKKDYQKYGFCIEIFISLFLIHMALIQTQI